MTYAVSCLKGTAQCWYEPNPSLEAHEPPDHALYWGHLKKYSKLRSASLTRLAPPLKSWIISECTIITTSPNITSTLTNTQLSPASMSELFMPSITRACPTNQRWTCICGRPNTLAELRAQAINLDLRYWKRKEEDRYKDNAKTGQYPSKTPSGSLSSTSHDSGFSRSHSSRSASRSSTPAASGSSTSKSRKPDLSKVLGPDGNLLPEEKERRKKQGLCIICASKDHLADQCPARKDQTQGKAAALDRDGTLRGSLPQCRFISLIFSTIYRSTN
jgi:hypothetical protein